MTPSETTHDQATPSHDRLDPQIAAFGRHMALASRDFPPFETLSPETARKLAAQARATLPNKSPAGLRTDEHVLEDVSPPLRYRIYRPEGQVKGVLVYLHGGGWTIFSLDTHDRLMRAYAAQGHMMVIGLDYALAPEHVFPVAMHQIVASLEAFHDSVEEIRGLPVFLGGDSAGANLSLATAIALRDSQKTLPAGLLLSYGVYDARCEGPSYGEFSGPEYMLTQDEMIFFWERYVPDAAQRAQPLASPINADVRSLPPCFLTIAECDVLADENRAMATRLRESDNDVTVRQYTGATHSFLEALDTAAIARNAISDQISWMHSLIGQHAS